MTIAEALERFLVQLEADGRSSHTVGQYRRHVVRFAQWAALEAPGREEVAALDHVAIARFLASPWAKERAVGGQKKASSVNALRSSLRIFCAYLHQAGYLGQDPGRLVRRALCAVGPPKGLAAEEQERLLAVMAGAVGPEATRDHALFHLLLATGVRLSAALGLNVEDLDLAAGEITIRTKGDRTERVFLGEAIREHLRSYIGDQASGPLFQARGDGVCRRHVQRRLSEWARKAGIKRPVSPHALRHTFAMGLYQKTGDILVVKEALHHRSIGSTLVYAQATAERVRDAIR
jgi:site-specific recombinase XerC